MHFIPYAIDHSSPWAPLVFPQANRFQTGDKIRRPSEECGRQKGVNPEHHCWRHAAPIFSTMVDQSMLNHVGIAYGGHIFCWHMQAAINAARAGICHFFTTPVIRVESGDVHYRSPTYLGQEVCAFITSSSLQQCSTRNPISFRATYTITLATTDSAHTPEDTAPAYHNVGSSMFQLRVTCPLHDPALHRAPPLGVPVSELMGDLLCPVNNTKWSPAPPSEAILRRYAQLATVADYRLWEQTFTKVRGVVAPETLKTRSLTIEFFDAVTRENLLAPSYMYKAEGVQTLERLGRSPLIVAQASVVNDDYDTIMRASAEMVSAVLQ